MKHVKYVLIAIISLGLLGALLIPTTPAVSVVAAENLAANGDLELGSTSGWEIADASLSSSVKHSGNYSLKLTSTSIYSGAAYKTVPVRSNATVTVSFYYRYDTNPGNGKTYHVYTYQGPNANVGAYSNADASFAIPSGRDSITTWKQISYTFNSGNYDKIYLKFCPGGSGSSACYIDDLVVTAEGGDEKEEEPYLTSYGTKMNRPKSASYNLIQNGGFESTANAQWNVDTFVGGAVNVVEDSTAPEGSHSLCLSYTALSVPTQYSFPVAVEKYTQYTFSAWVKSPRLSNRNQATATFGVANAATGDFLVYDAYNGNGNGSASLSTKKMQLMATSPDDEWHLRSVTFYSGTHSTVNITISGTRSYLYLDDIALYKSSNGVEYISPLRTDVITANTNGGNQFCADEDSLIQGIYMTSEEEQETWSDNPAWRNGFLSFVDSGDSHGKVLKYTASDKTNLRLHYIDWIDVTPNTQYTLTLDLKRLTKGDGRIALLDDNYESPTEFYTVPFSAVDGDWTTVSVTFTTQAYSRIGFAIVDGGGSALIDEVRLFETTNGIADRPVEPVEPMIRLEPNHNGTNVMEMVDNKLGVAFRVELEGSRIMMTADHRVNLDSASVIPYDDGLSYRLVGMGAVLTNRQGESDYTALLTRENDNGSTVVDVPVVYVMETSANGCSYAFRVANVPVDCKDTVIYARPYYVFKKGGKDIVVYGEIAARSYNR